MKLGKTVTTQCRKVKEVRSAKCFLETSPAGAVAKYCDVYVCLSACVCLSFCPRGYLRNHIRDLYQILMPVAYVRGSVLLRHVDDRLHRLPAGRG